MKKLIFCILCICMMASHCRETDLFLAQDTTDYFDFPVGSYWIYANDSLGVQDTITVTNILNNENLIDGINHHSKYIAKQSVYWNGQEIDWLNPADEGQDFVSRTYEYWNNKDLYIYESPGKAPSNFFLGEGSKTVRGNSYIKVRHFRITDHPDFPGDTLDYWFAPGVGTIKYEILGTDTIFELESYHINS